MARARRFADNHQQRRPTRSPNPHALHTPQHSRLECLAHLAFPHLRLLRNGLHRLARQVPYDAMAPAQRAVRITLNHAGP